MRRFVGTEDGGIEEAPRERPSIGSDVESELRAAISLPVDLEVAPILSVVLPLELVPLIAANIAGDTFGFSVGCSCKINGDGRAENLKPLSGASDSAPAVLLPG